MRRSVMAAPAGTEVGILMAIGVALGGVVAGADVGAEVGEAVFVQAATDTSSVRIRTIPRTIANFDLII